MSERERELQVGKLELGPSHGVKVHRGGGVEIVPLRQPAPALTPEERRFLSVAAVGASSEVSSILQIIERLTGEKIIPADEVSE